jgi:hypothetical protein
MALDANILVSFGTAVVVLYTYISQRRDAAEAAKVARENKTELNKKVDANTDVTNSTHDLVNGRYSALVKELEFVKALLLNQRPGDSVAKAISDQAKTDSADDAATTAGADAKRDQRTA